MAFVETSLSFSTERAHVSEDEPQSALETAPQKSSKIAKPAPRRSLASWRNADGLSAAWKPPGYVGPVAPCPFISDWPAERLVIHGQRREFLPWYN